MALQSLLTLSVSLPYAEWSTSMQKTPSSNVSDTGRAELNISSSHFGPTSSVKLFDRHHNVNVKYAIFADEK